MSEQNKYLSQQDLIDHAKNPRNYGMLKVYDFISGEFNPSCGDSVTICGIINENFLQDVKFEGNGCMLSLAMASKLTSYVKGMSIEKVLQLSDELVTNLLKVSLGPNRLQCGMLSILALQRGIMSYKNL